MDYCRFFGIVVAVATWCLLDFAHSTESADLDQLGDEFFTWTMREWPEFATTLNVHDYDEEVESFDVAVIDQRQVQCQEFLRRARAINADPLTDADHLTLSILIDKLDTFVEGYRWKDYGNLNSINFLEVFHFGWISNMLYESVEDFHRYSRRLQKLPKQIEEMMVLMQRAIVLQHTNHEASMEGAVKMLNEYAEQVVEASRFYRPYEHLDSEQASNFSRHERESIRAEGKQVITSLVQPAFRRLSRFISTEYMHNTRPVPGVCSLPNGTDYYEDLLRWHLSESRTAAEVHELGKNEVRRITQEMIRIIQWFGHSGNVSTFFGTLINDTQHYETTEEELLQRYRETIFREIVPRLPPLFDNLDAIPNVTVVAMPRDTIPAYYSHNYMVVNTHRPYTRATYEIMAISLHEALPGHHLQISIYQKLDVPRFRKALISGKKYSAPMVFPYYSAYLEGWGLYAENLGMDMHLFDDPMDLLGKYCFEIFRAVRLVVDTGIHAFSWSRDEAIQYMRDHTCLKHDVIDTEIKRYITWPGQACSYKIGELKLNDLRTTARKVLGSEFNIREFHSQVLNLGPVPLRLLEDHILKWVHSKQLATVKVAESNPENSAARSKSTSLVIMFGVLQCLFSLCKEFGWLQS